MQPRNNGLQEFDLTEEEAQGADVLTSLNRVKLQNLRVSLMVQKFALAPTLNEHGSDPTYWQAEAHLRGQMDLIDQLLEADDTVRALYSQNPQPN